MNIKKILTAVMALCVIAGTPVVYNTDFVNNTAYAENAVTIGSITLDNEHPTAVPTITWIDKSQLRWYTSDENVATVDANGKVTAVGKGTCIIAAYCIENNTPYYINVTSEYEYKEPEKTEIHIGDISFDNKITSQKINFNAPDGTEIKYSSTDESVAVVSADGTVTAKGEGKCRIYADIENTRYYADVTSVYTGAESGITDAGTFDLTVDSPMKTISISGISQDTQLIWSSSDESIAVVSKNGTVSGIKRGSCTVYAEADGKKFAVNINVTFNLEDIIQTFEIKGTGEKLILSYTGMTDDVLFSSSDENVAVVDSSGNVTSTGAGEAVIKAESTGGIMWVRIKVSDKAESVLYGDANCDGSIDIADATAIIQHIGNKDRYCLSENGLINADVDGTDGITGMDAVVIQQLEAGIINSLPLSPQS